jgi:hypothetical protein
MRCRTLPGVPEQDSRLHFHRLPVDDVRFKFPLLQRVSERFCLIGKSADEMNMFYSALFVYDDPDRNGSTRAITLSSRA